MISKDLIVYDLLDKWLKIRYDLWGKLFIKIELGVVILEFILFLLGLLIRFYTGNMYLLICVSTIPNLLLTIFVLIICYLYTKVCNTCHKKTEQIKSELKLVQNFNDYTQEELYVQFNEVCEIKLPPFNKEV